MAAETKKRMSAEKWAEIRATWEADPRDGYTWVINEMGLTVSHVAILKRARNEGWAKKADLKTIVERAQAKADLKVTQRAAKVTEAATKVTEEVTKVTDSQSVDLRADVLDKHRSEWGDHRESFLLEDMLGEGGLGVARVAKTAAEAIKIRQEGERKAWGLDAISEPTGSAKTLDELDVMFEMAMKRSQEMREAVRKERGGSNAPA